MSMAFVVEHGQSYALVRGAVASDEGSDEQHMLNTLTPGITKNSILPIQHC